MQYMENKQLLWTIIMNFKFNTAKIGKFSNFSKIPSNLVDLYN